ncbi:MAG: hypothetical protein A3F18_07915 [Legionellales bacterium RIFCSPHIGHO2_12_FULL_37_14]|nr:MAG: hypothetical protein A3F18_07915 [Legionellales bacterium RIFCSPHIGHO2_12_FULL_37_14]
MKKYLALIFCLSFLNPIYAAPMPALKIAANMYNPPFVMQGANKILYGFDIDMMEHLCNSIERTCQYNLIPFHNILDSVENGTNDIGIGGVTITIERTKAVAFSIPYLLSYAQYLGLKTKEIANFSDASLANKKIGIEAGSVLIDLVNKLTIPNIKVVEFKKLSDLIDALNKQQIDLALMDSATAIYWQNQYHNRIVTIGEPFLYGYGFGIAVNKSNAPLLEEINTALLEYQNNGGFQKAYNQYIAQF